MQDTWAADVHSDFVACKCLQSTPRVPVETCPIRRPKLVHAPVARFAGFSKYFGNLANGHLRDRVVRAAVECPPAPQSSKMARRVPGALGVWIRKSITDHGPGLTFAELLTSALPVRVKWPARTSSSSTPIVAYTMYTVYQYNRLLQLSLLVKTLRKPYSAC
jgi:hypothetical protein